MLVLLPPSKTMRPGGAGAPWEPSGPLAQARERVAAAYERLVDDRERFGRTTEASGDVLDDAIDQARGLRTDPTGPAGERYSGQLHLAAGYATLDRDGRRRYARHVRVVSALLGIVAPDELVPRYRLPMGAELPSVGRVATFWREALGVELARQAGGRLVWDLLSAEYRRALPGGNDLRMARVRFERPRGDGWQAAPAVIGKQLKGAFARHVSRHHAEDDPDGRAAAEAFTAQGYRYVGDRAGTIPTVVYQATD